VSRERPQAVPYSLARIIKKAAIAAFFI